MCILLRQQVYQVVIVLKKSGVLLELIGPVKDMLSVRIFEMNNLVDIDVKIYHSPPQ